MNQSKKHIEWVRWHDPFIEADEQKELDKAEHPHLNFLFKSEEQRLSTYKGTYIFGPLGLMPLTDYALPSRQYNLWIGNTNFNVSKKIIQIIENVDGVEILKPLSRYRIWVGVGLCFDHEYILKDISNAVSAESVQKPSSFKLVDIANKKFKYWAICHIDDKYYEVVGSNDKSEFNEKLKVIQEKYKDLKIEHKSENCD